MTQVKTKDWKKYSNTVRYAQSADGKDWFMSKRKSINKQNKRPSIKNLIIKGIDKLTGYHRKPDYYVHDYEKAKRGLERLKYGEPIPKEIKVGDKKVKNVKHGQSFLKTLFD